jgi:2-amino-4-hydroxy-6-hydroxymethyldihydropteridine diphosphokinase
MANPDSRNGHPGLFSQNVAWLGLGANVEGPWGCPADSFRQAITSLQMAGLRILAVSPVVGSSPVGPGRQPPYANIVIAVEGSIAPSSLLRLTKGIERRAGRRRGRRWGPRPLDIDVLSHGGRTFNTRAQSSLDCPFVLPHPEAHRRGFVLVPLVLVAPHWRHPVLGLTATELLARQPWLRRGIRLELRHLFSKEEPHAPH